MSSPYPLEDAAQLDRAQSTWNPWEGPAKPSWYAGLGFNDDTAYMGPFYRLLEGAGQGAAKGESLLAGLLRTPLSPDSAEMTAAGLTPAQISSATRQGEQLQERGADQVEADARARVKAMTPDAATTGIAAQTINGLASGVYRYSVGSLLGGPAGAVVTLAGTEGVSRYQELKGEGVDATTAGESATLAGVTAGAGALLPGGWGSSLLTRVATGAGGNVGFGAANRYLDHQILEAGGYKEMADQQRVLDTTQLITDTVLGAAFGGLAHLHARAEEAQGNAPTSVTTPAREVPGLEDAALAANLALRDRAAAPGVATDPAAASAHQAALEEATASLLKGEPVDVSGTGVDQADFAARPLPDISGPEELLVNALKESGVLDEERNLRELEEALGRRMRGEPEPEREPVQTPAEPEIDTREPESVTLETPPEEEGYTVGEEELTDEQRQAFERLSHPQGQELQATLGGGGETEGQRPGNDEGRGGAGRAGEPTRVYRGGRGGPLTPEHFSAETLGRATGHPSSGLGVFFTGDASDAAQYGTVTEHDLALRNPKHVPVEDLPGFNTLAEATAFREQLRGEGHDGIVIDASHLGGPKHYVVFEPGGVASAGAPRELPRLQTDHDLRAGLSAMKDETGWAQVGGRIIRDPETEQVTGRTSWIPNADWWPGRPKGLTEKQVHAAVDKALAGQPLSKREQAMVDFMTQVHDERVEMARTHAELQEAVPDLKEQPPAAVDLTVLASRAAEHDLEAAGRVMDSWEDDHPETIARVRGELEQIIGRGQEALKAEADRHREPAQAQRAPTAGGDLFGQDTRSAQALADETRRRDLLRSPNRDVSLETGRPDDLFSQSRQQLDITDTLADHADLQIADENGKPTSAAAALQQSDVEAARAEQEAPKATEAAVNCFLRKGGT